jgi:hypothetical protein
MISYKLIKKQCSIRLSKAKSCVNIVYLYHP